MNFEEVKLWIFVFVFTLDFVDVPDAEMANFVAGEDKSL
jgi:hypothetical protein